MSQNHQQPDMDLAMFAAMVGGQLKRVDNSMVEVSRTQGTATKIDPYQFLRGTNAAGNTAAQYFNPQTQGPTKWYAPDEAAVQQSVPDIDVNVSSLQETSPQKTATPRTPTVVSKAHAPSTEPSIAYSTLESIKSIDKTLKQILKLLKKQTTSNELIDNDFTDRQD